MRTCVECGEPLPEEARADKRYCDVLCRMRAYGERKAERRRAFEDALLSGEASPAELAELYLAAR